MLERSIAVQNKIKSNKEDEVYPIRRLVPDNSTISNATMVSNPGRERRRMLKNIYDSLDFWIGEKDVYKILHTKDTILKHDASHHNHYPNIKISVLQPSNGFLW